MGLSPKSKYYNEDGEGLPFHQGVTDFGRRFPTHRRYCTVTKRIANPGDILFSVRAPVGRINIADRKLVIGRGVAAINRKDGCNSFQLYQLKNIFKEEDSMGSGTILASVTKKDLQHLKLITPPREIIRAFEDRVSVWDEQIANNVAQNKVLAETRDYLLPKLLSGEIEVPAVEVIVDSQPEDLEEPDYAQLGLF